MDFKKIVNYTTPFLLVGGLLIGCGDDAYIDQDDPNYIEVVEDIAGNANGVAVTADQLNAIDGVSGAIESVDYATALAAGTFADPSNPTAEEIQAVVDEANGPAPLPANITIDNAALQKAIGSIIDTAPWAIDVQGVIDADGLKVTVPYTVVNAPVTLPAYARTFTLDSAHTEDSEAGIIATFSWTEQTDLPVGQGTFSAMITIDDSDAGIPDDTYNAKKLDIQDDIDGVVAATFRYATNKSGDEGNLTLTIYPGIPDRMFGTVDNNRDANTHMLLYLPVTNTTTGKTWLSNNLGANYANINDSAFDIAQQAIASNDHNAYGSLFQWGRKADGHELIVWTDGSTGTSTNATTATNSDEPMDALFITELNDPYDWRNTQDNTLWANEASTNNVCPVGYRLPTGYIGGELDLERLSWINNDASGALSGNLSLPMPGTRNLSGTIYQEGIEGYYWGSTVTGTNFEYSKYLGFSGSNTSISGIAGRVNGFTVRCIKD